VSSRQHQGAPEPLYFDFNLCSGCNKCVEVCQVDILIPNPEKGLPPIVLYPGECWYEGCCVDICPRPGAIKLYTPKLDIIEWKEK
jgi:NAD-dependent dihydropyrimidine dehydrogenase PreA subunit